MFHIQEQEQQDNQVDIIEGNNNNKGERGDELENILQSTEFQNELRAIGGYDISKTGQVIYETN
ncbi:DNA binding domain protein, excisionase [Bacillus cereus Rock3-44]|nr:DNA binding domain protein, excisionase [Bacillus cereus Rock3-44]